MEFWPLERAQSCSFLRHIIRQRNILFDLDGTITNPFLGITNCIRYAFDKLGLAAPEDLKWCIGPPLQESFRKLLGNDIGAERALAFYRERYTSRGIFETDLYDGIPEMLASLSSSNNRLYLATSKPQVYAHRIIEHFGLTGYFHKVFGSELDGTRTNKGDLIKYILESESIPNIDSTMVGDRMHDLVGAKKNEMRSIGVTWGFGDFDELKREGPVAIVHSPQELAKYLLCSWGF